MIWSELCVLAKEECAKKNLPKEYQDRLKVELYEIEKQGANQIWVDNYNSGKKWDINPNGLVIFWLLGMTTIDPIVGKPGLFVEDEEGIEQDAIVIETEKGQVIISLHTLVNTTEGYVEAGELTPDHMLATNAS
jgi:hypothetical protein